MTNPSNTILVVTPHPDDAEGGAGGTIARFAKEGKKVVLVVCTNGDKGTSDRTMKPEKLAAIREKEQLDAAEALGLAEVVFLRFPDQNLEDSREFRLAISRQIRKHRPDLVITIDPDSNRYIRHRDHYMTGRVTLDAVFPLRAGPPGVSRTAGRGSGPLQCSGGLAVPSPGTRHVRGHNRDVRHKS